MASIAADAAGNRTPGGRVARDRRFYVWMSGVIVVIAFSAFTPTFWSKVASSSFTGAPILYVHGLLFFSWTLFLFSQSALVASGRTLRHKDWGLAGIALATAMACSVVPAVLSSIGLAESHGFGDAARRFAVIPLVSLVVWVGLLIVAFANVRRPEIHKRLVILATVDMLQAAFGRVVRALVGGADGTGPPPVFVSLPAAAAVDVLIVAAMIYDWRTRGRPHPAYFIGGVVILAQQLLIVPLSMTPQWMAFVQQLELLRG